MHTYEPQQFDIPELTGLSQKQMEVHLKLYEGYVKHVNLLREQVHDLENQDKEKYAYAVMELRRRLGFEFDGMRMHEYYFESFEGGANDISDGPLKSAVSEKYGSWDAFIEHFTTLGKTRGIGWTILYWDPKGQTPHTAWVEDHQLGQLAGLPIIHAMDMWEHAFMVDYTPAEKGDYISAFLANTNWEVPEKRFAAAQ